MRIGLDVGGTNTDAALMDGSRLVAQAKRPTTPDVTSGIMAALKDVLSDVQDTSQIKSIMLGTTHFTNALLERRDLAETAIIRICLPATKLLPPLVDWPNPLKEAIGAHSYMVHGGHEFDGREISPLDEEETRNTVKELREKGVKAVALCGVFSPVDPAHEELVANIVRREAPEISVTLSHEIGRIGILERENAAALNACLSVVAQRTISSLEEAVKTLGLKTGFYLSQNDGTIMDAESAKRFPVFTIASGPTNSMRGAASLSGVSDGIVLDIGGTSTDGGALVGGFPREASVAIEIAGVRTNFRMPDVLSIALGGGSIIRSKPLRIGPDSVGYRLTKESLAFGGATLTTTDVAVAAGIAEIGNPKLVRDIEPGLIEEAQSQVTSILESIVDQLKLSAAPVPVVLVGGGSILVRGGLSGASEVIRPAHGEVANAVGAAMAQVGGQVEKTYSLADVTRQEALDECRSEAIERAEAAGADPKTIEVVEVEEIPMTYLPGNATRVRVKAVGDLKDS